MSCSKQKYTPSYDLPEELLPEILKRLPVKYVLRCGAVQKSWYSLIRTPMFISLHSIYQKMTTHVNPKYLLIRGNSDSAMTIRSDDAQFQEYCTFGYPDNLPNSWWYAESNGLICVSTMFDYSHGFNPDIHIWNPLVQKFKTIPNSPLLTSEFKWLDWKVLAFGFLPGLNDYVVVHVVKPSSTSAPFFRDGDEDHTYEQYPHSVVIGVYSLNTNSWKKLCQDKVFVDSLITDRSVFVNGTAFWVGYYSNELGQLVMYFDTKTNILGQVTVPDWVELSFRQEKHPRILPFGQSIAYFVEVDQDDVGQNDDYGSPHLDVWVLKDDKIDEFSWEKIMSVGLSEGVLANVLGIRNRGDPILAKTNSLISFDLNTHEPYDFVRSTPYFYHEAGYISRYLYISSPYVIRPFVETLVLLDID